MDMAAGPRAGAAAGRIASPASVQLRLMVLLAPVEISLQRDELLVQQHLQWRWSSCGTL